MQWIMNRVLQGGVALVLSTGVVVGVDTSSAFAQGYKTSSPTYVVGPGGSGTTYFSGPATYCPDSLHLCTESSYDLACFGSLSFCASDVPLVKLIVEASGACLFGGVGAVVSGSSNIQTSEGQFAVGCAAATGAWGWIEAIGALATPVHLVVR